MSKPVSRAETEMALILRGLKLIEEEDRVKEEARALLAQAARSGFVLPLAVQALAGVPEEPERDSALTVPIMKSPDGEPEGLGKRVIWVPATSQSVQVSRLALAILAQSGREMTLSEIREEFCSYREVSSGTLANAGTALGKHGLITRGGRHGGWKIHPDAECPILSGGYLWGDPELFGKYEIAWFRREAIKHLLKMLGALQQMQIVEQLLKLDWVYGPKDKDIVKADLDALKADGHIHRVSHSRKWVLSEQEGSR